MKALVVCCLLFALVAADNLQPLYVEPKLPGSLQRPPTNQSRITGGQPAVLGQFPHQAGLKIKIKDKTAFCGGTLISNRTVLTAAHCCDKAEEVEVILGSVLILQESEPSRVSIKVPGQNIRVHNRWSSMTLTNDICILKLPQAVKLSDKIQPAQLPANDSKTYYRKTVIASGWGKDSDRATSVSPILRYVESKIVSQLTCSVYYFGVIKDTHICIDGSGGKSTCSGDSGGPLVLKSDKKTVIGITSFGISFGCEIGWPAAFTRVSKYLAWIKANMD